MRPVGLCNPIHGELPPTLVNRRSLDSRLLKRDALARENPAKSASITRTKPRNLDGCKITVYGLNGDRANFVIDLSVGTCEHAI